MEEEPSAPQQLAAIEALPQLSRCGAVSAAFRRAAAAALRARLGRLCRTVRLEMSLLERRAAQAALAGGREAGRGLLHVQRRHSVLRLLLAVIRVIRACCWRLVFSREGSREGDGSILCCDVQLQGDARLHLPLDLEHLAGDVPPLAPPPPPPPGRRPYRSCEDLPARPFASWLSVGATSEDSARSQQEQGDIACFAQAHSRHAGAYTDSESAAVARDVVASLLSGVLLDTVLVPGDETSTEEVGVQTSNDLLYLGGSNDNMDGAYRVFEDTLLQSAGSEDSVSSCPTEADWSYSFSMSMSLERPLYDGGLPHQQVLVMLTHSLSNADVSSYTDVDL
ncbi:uncharacterized protein LOC126335793 [Schistocerca gregaria]|uniref:uncharacterized protein LOC126335793 n=1 Tax=Schistocerca gregaria TaxID=7010 RepID=UPI00211EEFDF|nr:uncharacterized protein LOC126335793 [Schistocerca gregaria]